MELKLTGYVRITISLLYKQKTLVKFRYLELFKQNFEFSPIFRENCNFQTGSTL